MKEDYHHLLSFSFLFHALHILAPHRKGENARIGWIATSSGRCTSRGSLDSDERITFLVKGCLPNVKVWICRAALFMPHYNLQNGYSTSIKGGIVRANP